MAKLLYSRRTFISALAICCITGLGMYLHLDVSSALSMIAIAVAGSNAAEGALTPKQQGLK